MLVGAILSDEECAELIAESGIAPDLDNILNTRDHDDEIVLQVCGALRGFSNSWFLSCDCLTPTIC